MTVTIGIDVGGTKIAAGVVGDDGSIVARRRIPTESDDPIAIVTGITKVGRELQAAAPAAAAVGVGAAGVIDVSRGVVLDAPNLAWENTALRSMLEDRLGVKVVVDNDANVAALAEATYGAGKGAGDQVMLTVGTGVGGGMMIGGRLYRGGRGVGAEIGHMIVAGPDGPPCTCGNNGCLEAVASGTAIGRIARERAGEAGATVVLARAGGAVASITGELVGEAASEGDAWATGILAETGRWLGVGIASLINLLDPDIIVVGGGAIANGELLLGPAREAAAPLIIGRRWRRLPEIVPAALGSDAGIVGAGILARG